MSDESELPEGFDQQCMTIEWLRDTALSMFDKFIAEQSGLPPPDAAHASHEEKQHFLTLEETENIVREHAVISHDVYAVGDDTPEKAIKKVRVVMAALMQRIMSNVIQAGAGIGLLDVVFDDAANDFQFNVSEKGKRVYDRIQDQVNRGEEIDFNLLTRDED